MTRSVREMKKGDRIKKDKQPNWKSWKAYLDGFVPYANDTDFHVEEHFGKTRLHIRLNYDYKSVNKQMYLWLDLSKSDVNNLINSLKPFA